jgi:hypothetical protein
MTDDRPPESLPFSPKRDDQTFRWAGHERVVKRPPRTDDVPDDADPQKTDGVERWECLDCGLAVQGLYLGATLSSRDCPPDIGHSKTPAPPCDPTILDQDLEDLARRLATDADASVAEVAGRVRRFDELRVPLVEIERALRASLVAGGEV